MNDKPLWDYKFKHTPDNKFIVESTINKDNLNYYTLQQAHMEEKILKDFLNTIRIETHDGFYEFLDKFSDWDKEKQNSAIYLFSDLLHEMYKVQREGEN